MPPKPQEGDDKRQAAREVIDILQEISDLLVRVSPHSTAMKLNHSTSVRKEKIQVLTHIQNTHLDRTELSLCVSLIENGVNPDALAVRVLTRGWEYQSPILHEFRCSR